MSSDAVKGGSIYYGNVADGKLNGPISGAKVGSFI